VHPYFRLHINSVSPNKYLFILRHSKYIGE